MGGKIKEIFRIGAEVKVEDVRKMKTGKEDWDGLTVVRIGGRQKGNNKEEEKAQKG